MRSPELVVDGAKVRVARETAGHTQDSLAKLIGVSRSAVAHWESTNTDEQPHGANFKALCKALEAEPESLLVVRDAAA